MKPKDQKTIVWEIKCNKLEKLEPIPEELPDEEKKKHCIKNMLNTMDNDECNQEFVNTVEKWLQEMDTKEVDQCYNHLNNQLPLKNRWVTETNKILANVIGGINQCDSSWQHRTEQGDIVLSGTLCLQEQSCS